MLKRKRCNMNGPELDQLLKSARVPERTDDYWNDFPKEVTVAIRRQATVPVRPESKPLFNLGPLSAWGISVAAVCIIAGLALGLWRAHQATALARQLVEARKYYGEIQALFPNQVRAIVFDGQGAHF